MKAIIPKGLFSRRAAGAALLVALGVAVGVLATAMLAGEGDVRDEDQGAVQEAHDGAETIWTCSMHPQVRQPEPGLCPICGMALIPLAGDGDAPGPETVVLSERARTLAQIRTTPVQRLEGAATDLRLLGRIEPSETAIKNVTAWTEGRIDRLHVKVTGQLVHRGQVIATLYSPEVLTAHQDLIVARRQVERMAGAVEHARSAAEQALEASRNRLRLLGVPEPEIDKMAAASEPARHVAIRTPFGGTVMERVATEGAYVATGALLYKVADLSRVWVQLDAYEGDLADIEEGQSVAIHVEGIPEEVYEGEVDFIDPVVHPTRRTAKARVAVKNPNRRLRPGMFVEADIKSRRHGDEPPPLVIPSTAPLFTGRRSVVFVEVPEAERPTYIARTVRLGPKAGDHYPVIAGLAAGERVVTRGAFTLDADLQIRGGNSMMTAPDDTTLPVDVVIPISAEERRKLAPVVAAYLEVQTRLAADDLGKAREAAEQLAAAAAKARIGGPSSAVAVWRALGGDIADTAGHLTASEGVEAARGVFDPLSQHIITLLTRLGNPLGEPVRLAFCPMAKEGAGAYWVQQGEVVDNPYFGAAMRTCGEIEQTAAAGAYLMQKQRAADRAPAAEAEGHRH